MILISFTHLERKRHYQYFSFRSTLNDELFKKYNRTSVKVRYVVENAGNASYADAYAGYSTFVTRKSTPFDVCAWERTSDTSYDDGKLSWTHVHELNIDDSGDDGDDDDGYRGRRPRGRAAYFAYFPPYSYERHLSLISRCEGEWMVPQRSLAQPCADTTNSIRLMFSMSSLESKHTKTKL